jgi:beta-galactosidase
MLKWNWPAKTNVTVRAAANCDEVELFLNNHSLGRKVVSHNIYLADWSLEFNPGELKAVGYTKGLPVAESKLVTTGTAAKLQITLINLPVASDLVLFEIEVTDKNGLNVIDATDAVTVNVEGTGRLLGLDTGELVYDGLFKTNKRNAYQGRLLVTIQRTEPAGEIHVTATAPGLSLASIVTK